MNMKHTPLPWVQGKLRRIESPTPGGGLIIIIDEISVSQADSDFIIKAVNNHERLLAALRAFVSTVEATGGVASPDEGDGVAADPEWTDLRDAYDKARSAIQAAEEKKDCEKV